MVGSPLQPKNLREFLSGMHFFLTQKGFEGKVGGERIVFTKDGLMAVTTNNKHLAIRIFNVVSALALLEGIPSQTIRESETGQGQLNPDFEIMGWSMNISTPRTMLLRERFGERMMFSPRTAVVEDKLSKVVRRANRILSHPDKVDELTFWLESNTHMQDSEYAQSFTISWIIVERNLSNVWKAFLNEKNVEGNREDKLVSPGIWSIDYVIEALNLAGVIPEKDYKTLMDLKNKRNGFVHRGRRITKDDSVQCLNLATEIMRHDLEGLIDFDNEDRESSAISIPS